MMRKALWISTALLLFAAIVAPCVRADTATFTCPEDLSNPAPGNPCFEAAPTAPDVTFSSSGTPIDITWYGQAIDLVLPGDWTDSDTYYWGASNQDFIIGIDRFTFDVEPGDYPIDTTLPTGAGISEGGAIIFGPNSPPVGTPEPGTITLTLVGIGIVSVMRKRIARGLPQSR